MHFLGRTELIKCTRSLTTLRLTQPQHRPKDTKKNAKRPAQLYYILGSITPWLPELGQVLFLKTHRIFDQGWRPCKDPQSTGLLMTSADCDLHQIRRARSFVGTRAWQIDININSSVSYA
jgi:hypothetical protein